MMMMGGDDVLTLVEQLDVATSMLYEESQEADLAGKAFGMI